MPFQSNHFTRSPILRVLEPAEFCVVDALRDQIDYRGHLVVPDKYDAFVVYGPYWPMPSGRYTVIPEIRSNIAAESFGRLQICDNGIVIEDVPLRLGHPLTAKLGAISGLEIRIKAAGIPFVLEKIVICHLPNDDASIINQRAEEGRKHLKSLSDFQPELAPTPFTRPGFMDSDFDFIRKVIHEEVDVKSLPHVYKNDQFNDHLENWLKTRPAPRVVEVWGDRLSENWGRIADAGFDPAALILTASDHPRLFAKHAAEAGLRNAESTLTIASLRYDENSLDSSNVLPGWGSGLNNAQGGFIKLAALAERAFVTCPFSGHTLTTRHSVVVPSDQTKQVAVFYKFKSVKTFYVVLSGFAGARPYIYFPDDNLVLVTQPPTFEWGPPQHLIEQFYRLALPRVELLNNYLSKGTKICVLSATLNNVGHFFWNECSGLHQAEEDGYLSSISIGCLYSADFINPFEILKEGTLLAQFKCETESSLFEQFLSRRLFCVRFASGQVTDQLATRISNLAAERLSIKERRRIRNAKSSDYLLWFSLRNHNKIWLNQVEGAVSVIELLRGKFPTLSVYVDGTPDCKSILGEIKSRVSKDVQIYDGLTVSMWETIAWAQEIDSYVCAIGSALAIVTWLAGKRGVAHSETHHLDQLSFWSEVRTGSPRPLSPVKNQICDDSSNSYCNYFIDVDVIRKLFVSLI